MAITQETDRFALSDTHMIVKITTPIIEPTEGSPHAALLSLIFAKARAFFSFSIPSFGCAFLFKVRYSYCF
ncbi:hypothetical protein QWZ16_10960 [Vibrio ostreicida]|uniref:Uncharacterized protein n=1 Tax=Vibrio ostreicida TaxID=526588 RepID=A0ABT8BUZ5_9VIBR|nr:hypothetical protein [Vibrio ostreicida]MDN3610221.1 hypothetical protein [Vibrio ostreicida]